MDYWDPAAVNGLAKEREVVVFDNTGGGASSRVWASDRMWRSSQPSDVGCRGNDQTLFGRGAARPPSKAVRKGFVLKCLQDGIVRFGSKPYEIALNV